MLLLVGKLAWAQVIIYEIYGGGGNSGALYTNDYIVLYNSGSTNVSLSGYSIQYASATASSWTSFALSGTINAGKFFLVSLGSGGSNGSSLPTPDQSFSTNINATDGKIALLNTTSTLSTTNPSTDPISANVLDFIGYGNGANAFEGTTYAPAPSNTKSIRRTKAVLDTNQNGTDLTSQTPAPFNSSSGTLPISLLSFKPRLNDDQTVRVDWATATEENNSHFVVERSQNVQDFAQIAQVDAAGNSQQIKNYHYTDLQPLAGTNYYRLVQVDKDGRSQTYRPASVVVNKQTGLQAYPNPTDGSFVINAPSEARLSLQNLVGQAVPFSQQSIDNQQIMISTADAKAGVYILCVQTDEGMQQCKVIIR